MKLLKNHIIYLMIVCMSLAAGCQQEEENALMIPSGLPGPGDKAPNPGGDTIFPSEVIKEEYPNATRWQITWDDPDWHNQWGYARFFSTVDGSVHKLHTLNASAKLTAKADMDLLFGRVRAPDDFSNLIHHQDHVKATRFKPSDLTLEELMDITANNPSLFEDEYENNPNAPAPFQPYNYAKDGYEGVPYQNGEIYTFKTDRIPPKYGAIRVVETSSIYLGIGPRIMEVIVQKDGVGVIGGLTD